MWKFQKPRDEIFVMVKEKRDKIQPNIGFWNQLEEYEKVILIKDSEHELKVLQDAVKKDFLE